MSLSPEQILALRPVFEKRLTALDPFTPTGLKADGFQYEAMEVNLMWEGFLHGFEHAADNHEALSAYSSVKKPSEFAEDLRKIRSYSKCFTGAYDKKEPVFVLRAQDSTATLALAQWIKSNMSRMGESNAKLIAAKATLGAFIAWHHKKEPD